MAKVGVKHQSIMYGLTVTTGCKTFSSQIDIKKLIWMSFFLRKYL